jgi:hypothetical protein
MDGAVAFLKVMSFCFIIVIIYMFLWFGRGFIGRFLDKMSPFPYLREGGSYKYKNASEELTYQGNVLSNSIGAVLMLIGIYLVFGFTFFPTILIFPFFIPFILILLRIRTFSDDSILPETGIGYNPLESYRLSLIASAGFIVLLTMLWFNEPPLYFYIIGLILGLISYLMPIFPDYIGKFLHYELRTEKGQTLLWIITMFVVHILFLLLLGTFAIKYGSWKLWIAMIILIFNLIVFTRKLKMTIIYSLN